MKLSCVLWVSAEISRVIIRYTSLMGETELELECEHSSHCRSENHRYAHQRASGSRSSPVVGCWCDVVTPLLPLAKVEITLYLGSVDSLLLSSPCLNKVLVLSFGHHLGKWESLSPPFEEPSRRVLGKREEVFYFILVQEDKLEKNQSVQIGSRNLQQMSVFLYVAWENPVIWVIELFWSEKE